MTRTIAMTDCSASSRRLLLRPDEAESNRHPGEGRTPVSESNGRQDPGLRRGDESKHHRTASAGTAILVLLLATGCGTLRPTSATHPSYYSLDSARIDPGTVPQAVALSAKAPTLVVNPSHAASGFDSQRIIYVRESHKLEYFAYSEWIDTPARMISPLIVTAIERTGTFRAVVPTPSAATGDLRLDTEIVRLQHEFGHPPSRVRFTLRTYIVDNTTRRVLAWREFDESVAAASDTPGGGIVAANQAVQAVLERLASFCSEAAAEWQHSATEATKRMESATPGR